MASNNINNFLLKEGFSETKKRQVYKKNLFGDYSIQIKPILKSGHDFQEMCIYLYSARFGIIMDVLFKEQNSIVWKYSPRKLRNDSEGCIGMALVTYESYCESEKDEFYFAKKELSLKKFLIQIDKLNTIQKLYHSIYLEKGFLSEGLNFIEGPWVYIFFCNEMNKPPELILDELKSIYLIYDQRKWRLKKKIDSKVLNFFKREFDLCRSGSCRSGSE